MKVFTIVRFDKGVQSLECKMTLRRKFEGTFEEKKNKVEEYIASDGVFTDKCYYAYWTGDWGGKEGYLNLGKPEVPRKLNTEVQNPSSVFDKDAKVICHSTASKDVKLIKGIVTGPSGTRALS